MGMTRMCLDQSTCRGMQGDTNCCLKHDMLQHDMLQQDWTPDPHLERLGGVRFRGDERRLDLLGDRRLRLLALSGLLALFFPL